MKWSQAFWYFPGDVNGAALGEHLPCFPAFLLAKENRPQPRGNRRPEEAKSTDISRE